MSKVETEVMIQDSLVNLLARTVKNMDLFITEQLKSRSIDLTKVQLMLLLHLKDGNGLTQQVLAENTNRDKASIARLIDTMERKNLVARIPSKSDRRINHVHITKFGLDLIKQAEPILKDSMNELLLGMSDDEVSTMVELLEKVVKNSAPKELVA